MYQQLALYKMLAARNAHHSFSPHATTSKLPNHLDFPHSIRDILDPSSSTSPSKGTTGSSASFRPEILQPTSSDVQALHDQIRRLQRDLHRAQSQLEEEKILRVERLRKASERCLELMTLSELGEGKVEVLRMKLKAERELREKLEEELESMRAADTARTKSQH